MRIVALVFLAIVGSCGFLLADDAAPSDMSGPSWPLWRGPNGNSIVELSASPDAVTRGKILWTASVGEGYSAICVAGNYAYTAGRVARNDTVVCLDAKSGTTVWSTGVESTSGEMPGTRFMPVFSDGKLYCLTRDGTAFCLNAASGALLWQTDIAKEAGARKPRWGFTSSAVFWKDLILFNVGEWGSAVRKDDGKLVWKSPPTASGYSPLVPFVYKDKSYAAVFGSGALYIADPETGAKVASKDWYTAYDVNVADPLVVGNRIFVTSDYGKGAALFEFDGRSLNQVWSNNVLKSHFSSVVYLDGFVYGNDGDANAASGDFVCLELTSGKEMWRHTSNVGSLIAVKNGLLTLNQFAQLALVSADPKKYTELASNKKISRGFFWPAPTLAGGRLYLRSNSGDVVCVEMPE
jgi:outer membrane protein assembly factor BamB